MGTAPPRLTSPTVGLMPTTPLTFAGHTMLPSVSVPIERAVKFADSAAAEPELEPHALRSSEYGLCASPPRADQPLVEKDDRKFAHSDRVVLPSITAPAARKRAATVESRMAGAPNSTNDPAVVCILSPVSRLSFRRTGMPSRGYCARLTWLRMRSVIMAILRASGFS